MSPSADIPGHVPVMPDEVVELVDPCPGMVLVDGTFGGGGHARLLAARLGGAGCYVGIDRDPDAAPRFEVFAREVAPLATRFLAATYPDGFAQLTAEGLSADAVILDVGVSSMQIDEPARGFSYMLDAPLDMRMDPARGESATQLLAAVDAAELEALLREFGEERHARRIARAICSARDVAPIERTGQLVEIVLGALPAAVRHAPGGHPARRVFQALRIAVNDELGMLDRGLDAALELLAPGGRLVVMSFHSLEDRMVKRRFEQWAGRCSCPAGLPVCGCGAVRRAEPLARGVLRPSADELAANPRSASTRLRAVRRVEPPVPVGDVA